QICGLPSSRQPYVWRGASSGNLYRPSPRQGNNAFQTGFVVGQNELTAVQAGDCRGETQAKPGTRLRTTLFKPYKALNHTTAVAFRNTGPAIGHREKNTVAFR